MNNKIENLQTEIRRYCMNNYSHWMEKYYELASTETNRSGFGYAEDSWCDEKFDWIIYASHESSITIGGWLLPEIQTVWSNWEERIWTTPFSTKFQL